jgi:hypothetical protein
LNCTFKRDQATRELSDKNLALSLKYSKSKDGKGSVLSKTIIDLGKHANGEQVVPVTLGATSSSSSLSSSSSGSACVVRLKIRPQWEVPGDGPDGKKIVPFDPATLQSGGSGSAKSSPLRSSKKSNKNQLRVRFAIRPIKVAPLDAALDNSQIYVEFTTSSSSKKSSSKDAACRSAAITCQSGGEVNWPQQTEQLVTTCHIKLDPKNNELGIVLTTMLTIVSGFTH